MNEPYYSYPPPDPDYYMPPVKKPAEANPSFATASVTLGILSMVLSLAIFPSYVCGGLGIFFSILSRGQDCKFSARTKAAIVCSVIGILIATLILTYIVLYISSHYGWENFLQMIMQEQQKTGQSLFQ